MANLDALRKLIREEVRAAFQDQLSEILKEAIMVNKGSKQQITEVEKPKKPAIPGTLNTRPFRPQIAPQLSPGNPLNSILVETARSMTAEDMGSLNFDSSHAQGFGGGIMGDDMMGYQPETQVVDSIEDMFATARPSSNMDAVQINAVPDYTELMSNLRAKGAI